MFFRFVQKVLIFTLLVTGLPGGLYATTRNPGSTVYIKENGGNGGESERTYQIGQIAEGGIIFWVTADKKHGLVVSLADIEISGNGLFKWRTVDLANPPIGAKARGVWIAANLGESVTSSGKINTDLICNTEGSMSVYAAKVCRDYRGGGYTDWYLPSLEELELMMAMQQVIIESGGNSFERDFYWSSLEYYSEGDPYFSNAWGLIFLGGHKSIQDQTTVGRVRACRAF